MIAINSDYLDGLYITDIKYKAVYKILHPTDFSENASVALNYAIVLANKFDAELVILHIGELPTILNSPLSLTAFSEMEEEKISSIVKNLKTVAEKCQKMTNTTAKIRFEAKLNNSIAKGILETIKGTGIDLVVMGTKGHSKLSEILMGSTTKALVAKAPCPVLAIPKEFRFKEIKQIVYASDFNENDITVLKRVMPFAQKFDANLSVLHVFTSEAFNGSVPVDFQQQLTGMAMYQGLKYDYHISGNMVETIEDYLRDSKADLLVMFEKENAGIVNFMFHNDMAKQFAIHTKIPVMIFNGITLHARLEV